MLASCSSSFYLTFSYHILHITLIPQKFSEYLTEVHSEVEIASLSFAVERNYEESCSALFFFSVKTIQQNCGKEVTEYIRVIAPEEMD